MKATLAWALPEPVKVSVYCCHWLVAEKVLRVEDAPFQ